MSLNLIDCTLRDGGYYNNWDFKRDLIADYLLAMHAVNIDFVELGFRSLNVNGFRGACAYTTDSFIQSLPIPDGLKVGVMVNAAELIECPGGVLAAIHFLFRPANVSPVSLVRIACHLHEFEATLPACLLLKNMGYIVGINLMQVADRTNEELEHIGLIAAGHQLDALYFADSLGSLDLDGVSKIVNSLKKNWRGCLGIHAHDNMGRAVANTMKALSEGVSWIDCTVAGMGRGPGNAQTEYVLLELAALQSKKINLTPLLSVLHKHFKPMQAFYGWGKNPYYFLAGQYGIHPTYIQEMLSDPRYGEEEILSVIEYLNVVGGKKYSDLLMKEGRNKIGGDSEGTWEPEEILSGREILIIGSGPTIMEHLNELERLAVERNLFVIALNTKLSIKPELINLRAACHPLRLLSEHNQYKSLSQPLAVPLKRIPKEMMESIGIVNVRDFGLTIKPATFEFYKNYAVTPSSSVLAYVLALATSGKALRIFLAGFDGFGGNDPRTKEMDELFSVYGESEGAIEILAVTPTTYSIPATSLYAL